MDPGSTMIPHRSDPTHGIATIHVTTSAGAASIGEVLAAWQQDREFRRDYTAALVEAPWSAYYWEHPPWVADRLDAPYQAVLVPAPALERGAADPSAFATHFTDNDSIVRFDNLGGDATLVVPTPVASHEAYPHLAAFVRGAPDEQVDALWRVIGDEAEGRIGDQPVWLSTAGLGVPWLHVRFDSRPKYYRHAPFKRW